MKHYLASLTIYHGDLDIDYSFKFATDGDPLDYMEKVAAGFYCDEPEEEDGVYSFFGGTIAVEPCKHQEISKEVFESLSIIYKLGY